MNYQLTSAKEVIARVENNFDIDYADWVTRAPLWIADALDQMQMIAAYEDTYEDLSVENHIIMLPDDVPSDIRQILGIGYSGQLIRRLNTINPVKQPQVISEYNNNETYSIKNGYIVTSIEVTTIRLYYRRPAIEFDNELQVYLPRVPINSIAQNAIGWYLIYCMLRRGHKHTTFSLDSKNPITNPYIMWEKESKKAMNSVGGFDIEERAEAGRLLRTFLIDTDRPTNYDFTNDMEINLPLKDSITGQNGII